MRLDKFLAEHGFSSRTKAARAIADGLVSVNGRIGKASDEVGETDDIAVRERPIAFVSEGGYKLKKALDDFGAEVRGYVCADLGASTGGFTDCLLQAGAAAVYAIDVGREQLAPSVRNDPRVRVLDGMNVRYLRREDIDSERIDVVTADLSFISLKLVFPSLARLLEVGGFAYVLVKPQFECGGAGLDKHGIVKDKRKRHAIVSEVAEVAAQACLEPVDVTAAPLHENKNVEYIICLRKTAAPAAVAERFADKIGRLE